MSSYYFTEDSEGFNLSESEFEKNLTLDRSMISCVIFFQAHSGSVWRVTWAHPEFGQVIATCSFDRTAAIWEELRKSMRIETIKMFASALLVQLGPGLVLLSLEHCS